MCALKGHRLWSDTRSNPKMSAWLKLKLLFSCALPPMAGSSWSGVRSIGAP